MNAHLLQCSMAHALQAIVARLAPLIPITGALSAKQGPSAPIPEGSIRESSMCTGTHMAFDVLLCVSEGAAGSVTGYS